MARYPKPRRYTIPSNQIEYRVAWDQEAKLRFAVYRQTEMTPQLFTGQECHAVLLLAPGAVSRASITPRSKASASSASNRSPAAGRSREVYCENCLEAHTGETPHGD